MTLHLKSISNWFFFLLFHLCVKMLSHFTPLWFQWKQNCNYCFRWPKDFFHARPRQHAHESNGFIGAITRRWPHPVGEVTLARSDCFHCSPETPKQSLHLKCMRTATTEDAKWDGKSIFNIFPAEFKHRLSTNWIRLVFFFSSKEINLAYEILALAQLPWWKNKIEQ